MILSIEKEYGILLQNKVVHVQQDVEDLIVVKH